MTSIKKLTIAIGLAMAVSTSAQAGGQDPSRTLITNVNVFDGFSQKLAKNMSVMIEGNHIVEVGPEISADGAAVIDGGGRTMTPGLIDMHGHVTFNTPEGTNTFTYEWDFGAAGALAGQALRDDMLMKGITTVRDIAGNSRGISNAIQKKSAHRATALYFRRCTFSHRRTW